jgi:hypothetical protein
VDAQPRLVVANVTSVSGVSQVVAKTPGGIVELTAHFCQLTVRRNVNCMRSLTVGHYLALSTLRAIPDATLLGYLLILFPRAFDRMI